jgi:cytochrome c oxidase subunit III
MSEVVPLRARPSTDDRAARIGMAVFVAGWTMMFGALLVAYLLLRQNAEHWPPAHVPPLDRKLPTYATLVLLASSITLQLGLIAIRSARQMALRNWLVVTLALAFGFLGLQVATFARMLRRGLDPTSSIYAAGFFGLTSFHAVHVIAGIVGLCTLLPRASRGAFSARAHTAVRSWTLYWHFVGVVWCAFFLAVYA